MEMIALLRSCEITTVCATKLLQRKSSWRKLKIDKML